MATVEAEIKAPPPPPVPEVRREIIEDNIKPGDTITSLLGNYFNPQQIHTLNKQSHKVFPLSKICAGQPFKLCTLDGGFERFEYDINSEDQLIIRLEEDGYTVETDLVRGTIDSSLFAAVAATGERAELALALADIFAWDVDFIRDIRQGDSFQAVVEKRFREGDPAGYGRILAAEFTNQGDTYRAFLFQDGSHKPSYYDTEGKSLRKAFLKAPLSFTRISSGFTRKRFHPITKTWKAHPAIDYAAPRGTPIKTVGEGVITRIGRTKYNGNFIKIRHNSTYETLYLHMNGFARGMKKGKRLSQGQVIGYVGSTGLATGPHLCFRMYKNDSPVNPYKVQSQPAAPISKENRAEFKAATASLVGRLDAQNIQQAKLAPTEETAPQQ